MPQIAILLFIMLLFKQLNIPRYVLLGFAIYFLLSGYLKIIIPRAHRKGLYYLRKGEFEGAVYMFGRSYDFFNKHSYLEKYRALLLLSLSAFEYREMAIMNIIYCYEKTGNREQAKKYHSQLKKEYPNNPYSNK